MRGDRVIDAIQDPALRILVLARLRALLLQPRALLSLGLYLTVALWTLWQLGWVAERIRERLGDPSAGDSQAFLQDEQVQTLLSGILEVMGWGGAGDAAEIVRDRVPLLLLSFEATLLQMLPLLVAAVFFDQLSELSTRGARWVLARVDRGTYLTANLVAGAGALGLLLGLLWLIAAAVALRTGSPLLVVVQESLRGWLGTWVTALPYLGLTALVSASVAPGFAFLATAGAWFALSLGGLWLRSSLAPAWLQWMETLLPASHLGGLVSRYGPRFAGSLAALVGIAAALVAVTALVVRRRDV